MDLKPPAFSQEEKKFNLLQPYGDSHYRVDVKMPGPELLTKLREDTASIFNALSNRACFCGSIKDNTFSLGYHKVNTSNSFAPVIVGRIVDSGNSCSVEFTFQFPLSAKIGMFFLLFEAIIFPLIFGIAVAIEKMPLLPALPAILLPAIAYIATKISLKTGEKDKERILEYFQQLPGADLQEQRQLF
jgi:hypothetical protein